MANAPRSGQRTRTRRSSRSNSNQQRRRTSSRTSRSGDSSSRRGTLTRPDTGYTLHSRRVRREAGSGSIAALLNPRVLMLGAIVLIVVIVIGVGISSCVSHNNTKSEPSTEEVKPKNEQDARVAAGVSAAMTSRFTEALDQSQKLAQIAENADKYDDERMLSLALDEPDAVDFVAGYPASDKSSRPYDGSVKRGEVPRLYNWDYHWGAVTYGDGPIALTGSGPTTLAMAYMGLTGKTDNTPTEIAQQASKSNYTDTGSGSKPELFSKLGASLGLKTETQEVSEDTLLLTLSSDTLVAAELKEGTITEEPHWVLVVNVNEDGSVTVFDPTSTAVSNHPWSAATIADASETFYSITLTEEDFEKLESSSKTDSKTTKSSDTDTTSNGDTTSESSKSSKTTDSEDTTADSSSSSSKSNKTTD